MILQIPFISLLSIYGPIIIYLSFDIAILIFAIFIYKKNSYKYGLFLMISSILSIVTNVIIIAINYPYLSYTLQAVYGLSLSMVILIMNILGLFFLALGISSKILFFVTIYLIYKTHRPHRDIYHNKV